MDVFRIVLYTTVVLIALLLIGLILIQQSKGGGFGSAFSGLSESVFGARAGSHLTKLTVILTSLFFFLTLVLAVVTGHSTRDESVIKTTADLKAKAAAEKPVDKIVEKPVKATPASPEKAVDKTGK